MSDTGPKKFENKTIAASFAAMFYGPMSRGIGYDYIEVGSDWLQTWVGWASIE